jgi:hypothetical protein
MLGPERPPGKGNGCRGEGGAYRIVGVMNHPPRRSIRLAAACGCVLVLAGCSDLGPSGKGTSVTGQLVDANSDGISDVYVGVLYYPQVVAAAPAPPASPRSSSPQAAAVRLLPPYPNPAETALNLGDVKIPVEVDADTTLTLEIVETHFGVTGTVATLHDGPLTQNTTFAWDGRGLSGDHVPNGLYQVRLTLPGSGGGEPTEIEEALLVNRPDPTMSVAGAGAYNAVSGIDGRFTVDDMPIGALIHSTDVGNKALGTARIRSQVLLYLRPIADFVNRDYPVAIGPGDQVEVTIQLSAFAPSPPPSRTFAR